MNSHLPAVRDADAQTPGVRNYTHGPTTPAVLLLVKDGMVQKAVLYGSQVATVYVREEGRGGFGHVPIEIATDFLAFDDLLTQEPAEAAPAAGSGEIGIDPTVVLKVAAILSIAKPGGGSE
jgi:hypothetical protein